VPYNPGNGDTTKDKQADLFSMNDWEKAKKRFEQEFFKQKLAEAKGELKTAAARIGVNPIDLAAGVRDE
jgi:DNA-binding NtrC family response regulator